MSKRGKFDKLGNNDSYYDTHADESREEKKTKGGFFSKLASQDEPEKLKESSRFSYTKEKRKIIYKEEAVVSAEKAESAPFVLVLVSVLLAMIAGIIATTDTFSALSYKKASIVKAVFTVVICIVPAVVYMISSPKRAKLYNIRLTHASMLPLSVVTLGLVASSTFLQIYFITYTFSYNIVHGAAPGSLLVAIATGALVPAVCEGLLVRGILQYEISKYAGGITGVLAGAVISSMIHLDWHYFTVYLVTGIILGSLTHISHSVFPAMLVHFLNNTLTILFADKLSYIAIRRISGTLLMIFLAALVFVFLIAMLRYAEGISLKRASEAGKRENKESDEDDGLYKNNPNLDEARCFFSAEGKTAAKMTNVFSSPYMVASYLIFAIAAIMGFSL